MVDATHDPALTSWVGSANGHADFPIQNLPLGVFSPVGGAARGGVAIGDMILDIGAGLRADLFSGPAAAAAALAVGDSLNALLGQGPVARRALRARVSELLRVGSAEADKVAPLLHQASECVMHVPARIGDYTDFFAGIHHASNSGALFRPENPLLPNYKYVPVAYHGRASSVRASGHAVRRPNGQRLLPGRPVPEVGPCTMLDFELELGVWVGPGNRLGEPVSSGAEMVPLPNRSPARRSQPEIV